MSDFSGVVRVDRRGAVERCEAAGLADRAHGVPNTVATRFAIASGTKGLTALTVMALVERGDLALTTTARSLLGPDLALIDGDVTVEHLLAHRSGIGDYFDETLDPPPQVPNATLVDTADYLRVLDGHPQVFRAGERFAYNNGGFVVLAVLVERVTGRAFADVVDELVARPAGMGATAFLRSDELPGDAARGYVDDGLRTNAFLVPVRGSGDGGIYTTVHDVHALWDALFAGRIVAEATLQRMITPRSEYRSGAISRRYGLGFWLGADDDAVLLDGADLGVSFRSQHRPSTGITWTVISNTGDGAWPVARELAAVT